MNARNAAEARFRAAFDHAPVGMAIVTLREHRVVRANRTLAHLLMMEPEQVAGRRMADFRDPRATPRLCTDHGATALHPPTFAGERACLRADGSTVWVEVYTARLPEDPDAAPASSTGDGELCLLHVVDITRRRAAEAERDRQQAWAAALGEVRLAVLLGVPPPRSMQLVCQRARILLEADEAIIVVPDGEGRGRVVAADGRHAAHVVHREVPLEGTVIGQVQSTARVVVTGGAVAPHGALDGLLPGEVSGCVLAIPLRTPDVVIGVLCLVRPAGRTFRRADIEIGRSFAEQASAALHIGELRADRERLRVLEDRERIARDLHDSVIQDLFAAGMSLNSALPLVTSPRAAERVAATIDQLDCTIKQIRSTIFELETTDLSADLSDALRAAVEARRDQLGFEPKFEVEGDLGQVAPEVMDHLVAIVSEALSNTARHAGAVCATVRVSQAEDGAVTLTISDDGSGFEPTRVPRGNGLANMHRRAALLRARFDLLSVPGRGTRLEISVPPPPQPPAELQLPPLPRPSPLPLLSDRSAP